MHLLYLDESGSEASGPGVDFFVLAGFSVFERQTHWLESRLDAISARFAHIVPCPIELHGAPMRAGKDGWKSVPPADRAQATVDILSLLADRQARPHVFASVVELPPSIAAGKKVIEACFEDLSTEFDGYLANCYFRKNPQRGIVLFDKRHDERNIQTLSHNFKHLGHTTGRLRNFAEVPVFLDSKASRLIQLADHIAYWIFRYYQSSDDRGYRLIEPYFHHFSGVNHGLHARVTQSTLTRLSAIQPHSHPFPPPSP